MKNETEKSTYRYVLDMIFRLCCFYVLATYFFKGIEDWRNGEYLLVGLDFSLVVAEIGLIFRWGGHKLKILRILMWSAFAMCLIFLILSKLS
ncbi:MAG: hypothetical protein K1X72_27450 [Pyrinomonadaceae bacterium]|nr:hypothetical protein [Pyrinomonadaceae bacterium]